MIRLALCAALCTTFGLVACDSSDGSEIGDDVGDDQQGDDDASGACPTLTPDDGTSCNSGDVCTYEIEACACGPSDIEWTCNCIDGGWSCERGYDCYPCPDAAVQ